MTLEARARKCALVAHIVAVGAWIGIDAVLGVLTVTALVTGDPAVRATSLQALPLFAVWPMLTAALLALATGVVLGLGTKYGLLRYWWVAAKLAVTVLMAVLILVALRPAVGEAAREQRILLYPVVVAPALLLFAVVLSVFKPWGRIRTGRRDVARSGYPASGA